MRSLQWFIALFFSIAFSTSHDIQSFAMDDNDFNSRVSITVDNEFGRQPHPNYFTPLQLDAEAFMKFWAKMNRSPQNEELIRKDPNRNFRNYVFRLMKADSLDDYPIKRLTAISEVADYSGDDTERKALVKYLDKTWKNLIDVDPNAFASYIIGHLGAPRKNSLDTSKSQNIKEGKTEKTPKQESFRSEKFKWYLNNASKKYYDRATDLLILKPNWQENGVTNKEIQRRQNMMEDPKNTLSSYIQQHLNREDSQLSWAAVEELESALYYIAKDKEDYNDYLQIHQKISDQLMKELTLRKEIITPWRNLRILYAGLVTSSMLSTMSGISNIIQSTLVDKDESVSQAHMGLGVTYLILSGTGFGLATVINNPYLMNSLYKPKEGKFIPSSYSNVEIEKQARIISLASILENNSRVFREIKGDKTKMNVFTKKLCDETLRHNTNNNKSLSSFLDKKNNFRHLKIG